MSETKIPRAEDIHPNSFPSYRFSSGQVVTGRDEDGTLKAVPRIVGKLLRVGIHRGTLDSGVEYGKLEAEVETADGKVSVSANLNSLMASITYGEGLLAVAKDELISIWAGRSKEKNRYGSFTTYANVDKVDPKTLQTIRIKEKVLERGISLEDAWKQIEERLKKHPAWGERPKRQSDIDAAESYAPFDDFCQLIVAKGWPKFEDAFGEYLAIAGKVAKKDFSLQSDVPDDIWAAMCVQVDASTKMPVAVQKVADSLPKDDEYDPFA